MSRAQAKHALRRPIRLWPGVVAVALLVLVRYVMPLVVPGAGGTAILGGLAGALAIIVWWLFFSRAPWVERLGALALMPVALLVTSRLVHPSIANGMMGMMLPIVAIPLMSIALVASVAAARRLPAGARRAVIAMAILLACGSIALVRTGGITGDGYSELRWRWTPTPEQRLLATHADEEPVQAQPAAAATPRDDPRPAEVSSDSTSLDSAADTADAPEARAPAAAAERPADASEDSGGGAAPPTRERETTRAEWPGFRGPARDGVVHGVQIETDWSAKPPVEIWRRQVGPGWSSFAVSGDLTYTQEQRGEEESVSAYRLSSGEPVWRHRDPVRFWESNGGPGPRATPTISSGRVHTLGATGILNALDARTGARIWSRNAATDTGKEVPDWGFAGSPLVVGDLVVVALAGQLVAYDLGTGSPRWFGPPEGGGYSSPHLATIDGVPQILLLRGRRTTSVAPADGSVLWEHSWQPGAAILQPGLTVDGDVLLTVGEGLGGVGMRRIAVVHDGEGWTTVERWTTRGLKPYFNDVVVHEGHAYGFDGSILACIDLADGERRWKGGRFGHGQLLLLAEQELLLVLSEDGELGLVRAAPDQFTEVARFRVLNAKTWNHPVLVGDILLVRNGEEMAAFRLPLSGR